MSWLVTGAEKVPVDKLGISNVSLLLHGNGANGSTTITDSSPSPKTVTAVGNAQISTAQSKFGSSSIAFDGTEDYLTFAPITYAQDFTFEAFFFQNNTTDTALFSGLTFNFQIRLNETGAGQVTTVYYTYPGLIITRSALGLFSTSSWNHIAAVRAGSDTRVFLNGTQVIGTVSNFTQPYELATIGGFRNDGIFQSKCLNGFIDEVRASSVARYTANFTPPTAPFPDI